MKDTTLSPLILKEIRARYNLSCEALAQILSVSRRTVNRWEAGTLPTKGGAQSLLKIFLENDEALLKQALEKQSSKAQDPN